MKTFYRKFKTLKINKDYLQKIQNFNRKFRFLYGIQNSNRDIIIFIENSKF